MRGHYGSGVVYRSRPIEKDFVLRRKIEDQYRLLRIAEASGHPEIAMKIRRKINKFEAKLYGGKNV